MTLVTVTYNLDLCTKKKIYQLLLCRRFHNGIMCSLESNYLNIYMDFMYIALPPNVKFSFLYLNNNLYGII